MYDVSESVYVSYLDATARKVSALYLDTKSGEVCVSYLDTFKKYLWTPLFKSKCTNLCLLKISRPLTKLSENSGCFMVKCF